MQIFSNSATQENLRAHYRFIPPSTTGVIATPLLCMCGFPFHPMYSQENPIIHSPWKFSFLMIYLSNYQREKKREFNFTSRHVKPSILKLTILLAQGTMTAEKMNTKVLTTVLLLRDILLSQFWTITPRIKGPKYTKTGTIEQCINCPI